PDPRLVLRGASGRLPPDAGRGRGARRRLGRNGPVQTLSRGRRQGGAALMSRLEVPLLHRVLWSTGDLLLRAELDLLLKDKAGLWRPQDFLVDSGTEMTTMPAQAAPGEFRQG